MGSSTLPVSGLINSTVNLSPAAAQSQNLSDMLILGSSTIIDVVERLRLYDSLSAVETDFGGSAPEYEAATVWFGQSPQPPQLYIGRWAETATAGKLIGATLSAAQQAINLWTAITAGSFTVSIDGGAATNVTGLNFSAATNLNGVASTIQAALPAGVLCIWNANYSRFEFTSSTTGSASSVSFLSAEGTGTDISGMLGGLSTSSGAYVADGIIAESALSAVTLFDSGYGQKWFGCYVCGAVDSDHLAIAAYIEGASTEHAYGVNTQESGCLVATDTTNIMYQLQQLKYNKTWVQYSSSLYAVISMMGRILTTNFNAAGSTITLMYKNEPGIVAENLNPTQLSALLGFNGNVFVAYDNNTSIIQPGIAPSGNFIDSVYGCQWLSITIQNTEFNLLYTSTTKIPQTDKGIHVLVVGAESVCETGVTNGLLGPGTWNAGGFGALNEGDFLSKGYYVYAAPLSTQSQADRAARKSTPIQVAAKLGGAVHTCDVLINVNP